MFPSSFYYWLKKEYMDRSASETMCWWVNTTVCDEKDKNWKCKVIVKHCVLDVKNLLALVYQLLQPYVYVSRIFFHGSIK